MKKTLLITALAAMTLVSCADDEPVSQLQIKNEAISFRPAMGIASRATETTNANLNDFYVTSLMDSTVFFKDLKYTKGSDGFYNSNPLYYWPGDDTPLNFYAYSPSMADLGADVIITSAEKQLQNFTIADNIADQVDFITANATGKKSENETSGLELTFGHRLAQIEIHAKSSSDAFIYKVAGIRIGRPQITGTYDFSTDKWTLDDWHETTVLESRCDQVTLNAQPVNIMGTSGNAMLIPQMLTQWDPKGDPDNVARGAYLSVYVNITTTAGSQVYPYPSDKRIDEQTNATRQYAWATIPLSGTWEAGKKYVYTLDFSQGAGFVDPDDPTPGQPVLGDPIKFTVQVTPWVDNGSDIPMPVK